MRKVFYSLLEISASLFSRGTSFQDLPNHSYLGKKIISNPTVLMTKENLITFYENKSSFNFNHVTAEKCHK